MEQNQKDPKMDKIIQIMDLQKDLTSEQKIKVLERELDAIEKEIIKEYPYAEFTDGTVLNVNQDGIDEEILEEYSKKWSSLETLVKSVNKMEI